ncbi:ASCH domain-containing protein [Asaia krungthepensis]|uniref:ASCH domain-containing protein n=1 Tax=Asaia krungthepensis TaxID=220990 RepID=UPI00222F36D0|nr:ASCH domain-containing protein [Asaia krungthepensis]
MTFVDGAFFCGIMTDILSAPPADWESLERFSFGDNPALADELLELVLRGIKTGTCWAAIDGQQTVTGQLNVVCDGRDQPRAIIRTCSLEKRRYCDVSADFAAKEGEGDRSLAYWRREHERYFRRLNQFSETMELWCEEFVVVFVFPETR